MHKVKVLVIGSKGFIGSNCFKAFAQDNHAWGCDVVPGNEENYFQLSDTVTFETIFAQRRYDVCINASGSANVGSSYTDPQRDFELNTANVEHMLNAIVKDNRDCRFINFSSAAVYGNPASLPVSETAAIAPLSPYGKNKATSEQILKKYAAEKGLKTCSLRVFSAYGPGLRKQLFWDIFQKAKAGNHVTLFGTGRESRDFIFIDDLTEAIRCIADKSSFTGEAVNVASGVETTIREAAREFLDAIPGTFELSFSGEVKTGDPLNWRADISLLKSYGFVPQFDFREGIRKTAHGYLND